VSINTCFLKRILLAKRTVKWPWCFCRWFEINKYTRGSWDSWTVRLRFSAVGRRLMVVTVPSVPRRLRVFVTSRGGGDVTRQVRVDLRWSVPAEPGGVISSYHVLMATSLIGDDSWNISTLAGEQLATKFNLLQAPTNTILYFKVCRILVVYVTFLYQAMETLMSKCKLISLFQEMGCSLWSLCRSLDLHHVFFAYAL